jgi:hypothetical protein
MPGDTSPGLASQQLALTVEAPTAQAIPAVKGGVAIPQGRRRRP